MNKRKYSVFLTNVASCSDRYCAAYGPEFTMEEIFDRVKSIPLLDAVDIVMTQNHITQKDRLRENLSRTGLKVASVAMTSLSQYSATFVQSSSGTGLFQGRPSS